MITKFKQVRENKDIEHGQRFDTVFSAGLNEKTGITVRHVLRLRDIVIVDVGILLGAL